MSREKTRGIVLSRILSGEADYICSIFTREHGKEKFVFKGLRKSKKRPRSASEPGTALDMIYYTGNTGSFNTVSEFDITAYYQSIRNSSDLIFSLYYMVEIIDSTTGYGDCNEKIYSLLSAGIDTLSKISHPLHFIIFFTARYMVLQGILPDASICSWCGDSGESGFLLDPVSLRMSCENCSEGSRFINGTASAFFRESLSKKFFMIEPEKYNVENLYPLLHALTAYIENYFGVKIKSAEMIGRNSPSLK